MDKIEAINENNRREKEEKKIFDSLFNGPIQLTLKKIKTYTENDKQSCQNDELIENKQYLIVRNGKSYLGTAHKAHFGWQFMADGYWHQLNHVDLVFDIGLPEFPSKPLGRVEVPPEKYDAEEYDY